MTSTMTSCGAAMAEITERLRERGRKSTNWIDRLAVKDAADEIDRLRALLREARGEIPLRAANIGLRERIDAALAEAARSGEPSR
jgi:hypothetical protein